MGGGENYKYGKCQKRGEDIIETLEHVITECEEYVEERNKLDRNITSEIGQLWVRKKEEEDRGLKTMLGLENRNDRVIGHTKTFLKEIWMKRGRKEPTVVRCDRNEHNYVSGD